MENTSQAQKFYKDIWDLPFENPERLDRAYIASAFTAKNLAVQYLDGNITSVDTWPEKTILMKCASKTEAERYLDLVNRYFTKKHGPKRKWRFKFLYPCGEIQE